MPGLESSHLEPEQRIRWFCHGGDRITYICYSTFNDEMSYIIIPKTICMAFNFKFSTSFQVIEIIGITYPQKRLIRYQWGEIISINQNIKKKIWLNPLRLLWNVMFNSIEFWKEIIKIDNLFLFSPQFLKHGSTLSAT